MDAAFSPKPRIVLVDDRATFRGRMRLKALRLGHNLYCFDSLASLGKVGLLKWFDVVILAKQPEQLALLQNHPTIASLLEGLPVLLLTEPFAKKAEGIEGHRVESLPKTSDDETILRRGFELAAAHAKLPELPLNLPWPPRHLQLAPSGSSMTSH